MSLSFAWNYKFLRRNNTFIEAVWKAWRLKHGKQVMMYGYKERRAIRSRRVADA